jgi:hypothetical protein
MSRGCRLARARPSTWAALVALVVATAACTAPNPRYYSGFSAPDGAAGGAGGRSSGGGAGTTPRPGGSAGSGGGPSDVPPADEPSADLAPVVRPEAGAEVPSAPDAPTTLDGPSLPIADVTTGLVGYWPLDEGPGSSLILDRSGNGNNGGIAAIDPQNGWTTGKVGAALDVPNAVGAGVIVAPTTSINGVRTAFTIAAWAYRDAHINDRHMVVLSRQLGNQSTELYLLGFHNNTLLVWLYGNPSSINLRANRAAPLTTWIHVAVTWDGQTVRLYQNGESVGTLAYNSTWPAADKPLILGNNANSSGIDQPLIGRLDEVRLYNRALPQAAIQALFNAAP